MWSGFAKNTHSADPSASVEATIAAAPMNRRSVTMPKRARTSSHIWSNTFRNRWATSRTGAMMTANPTIQKTRVSASCLTTMLPCQAGS